MTDLDSTLKSRDIALPTKVYLVKAMVFPVIMYGCESWIVKKAEWIHPQVLSLVYLSTSTYQSLSLADGQKIFKLETQLQSRKSPSYV